MRFVTVYGHEINVDILAAHLYLQTAEMMPEEASDEWFAPRLGRKSETEGIQERVVNFLDTMNDIMYGIHRLGENLDDAAYQTIFYEKAKQRFGEDKKELREFFKLGYVFLFNSINGPRWGQFVAINGVRNFNKLVIERLQNPPLMSFDALRSNIGITKV